MPSSPMEPFGPSVSSGDPAVVRGVVGGGVGAHGGCMRDIVGGEMVAAVPPLTQWGHGKDGSRQVWYGGWLIVYVWRTDQVARHVIIVATFFE